jgi:hypothetical protein
VNKPKSSHDLLRNDRDYVLGQPIQVIEEVDKRDGEELSSFALDFGKLARDLREHEQQSVYHCRAASLVIR